MGQASVEHGTSDMSVSDCFRPCWGLKCRHAHRQSSSCCSGYCCHRKRFKGRMSPLEGHFKRKNVVYELKKSVYDSELYSVSVFLIRETLWISFLIFKQHLI